MKKQRERKVYSNVARTASKRRRLQQLLLVEGATQAPEIEAVLAGGKTRTPDLGGSATTQVVGSVVTQYVLTGRVG